MKEHKYSINDPCKQNWLKMDPADKGRYCIKCTKTVVDFSRMQDEEIINYLESHRKERICGHFYTAQLENNYKGLRKFIINAYYRAVTSNEHSIGRRVVVMALVVASFITGCSRNIRRVGDVGGPVKVHNDTAKVKKDSLDGIKKQE